MISSLRVSLLILLGCSLALGCAHNDRRLAQDDDGAVADEPRPLTPREAPSPEPTAPEEPIPLHELGEEELEMALDRAIAAAVAVDGDSPCERSYNAMVAMRDSLVADLGEAAAQDLPSRRRFIEACEQLPEEAQRCMDVAYAMDNPAECQRIMDEVPPERRRALEEVLREP